MVKVNKVLTKEELLKENYELGQKVAKLEIQIGILKDVMVNRELKPVYPVMPIYEPYYIYPYTPSAGETGDPLPPQPNITICYDNKMGLSMDDEKEFLSKMTDGINSGTRVY